MEVASLPLVSIKINLNLKSLIPFYFSKDGLSFLIQKDLELPNCFIKIEITKGNVKDIKIVNSYISNPIVRKDMNNFVIQNIDKEQEFVNFDLCFEFVYKKWNFHVTDFNIFVPCHILSHLKFGDYLYEEIIFHQPDPKNGDTIMKFRAYWIRSLDSKKRPVFKLYVEKKKGVSIKGANKDNMVLTIPDKPRITHLYKRLIFFFDFKVYPQLSPSNFSSTDCMECLNEKEMHSTSPYKNQSTNKRNSQMPPMIQNICSNCNSMFPKTKNGTFGSPTIQFKEFSITNNSSNELSEITSQTMTTESQPLNSNTSIDGNIPPEFNEINDANCFSKSFIIGNALIKEKLFPESSLLSDSCHSYSNEIFIDKNREMLNSLPLNSEFNVPIGGRKPSFDNSASLFINRYAKSQSDSSVENADGFSIISLKTSTKAVPTSKPENQNELNFNNPVLAKFFEFHEPISPQSTNPNVLIKLFPSKSLTKSNMKKSTCDDSFEINDQSMIDTECPSSNFSESFKSTSSKPHNLDIY